jgi:carboxypeptidase C (cathepsin A)
MLCVRLQLLACFVAAASRACAATPRDLPSADSFLIDKLPGLATPPAFKQYSGFMPLGDAAGTHLFFWFVESQRAPATDPLLYWTNGGPGSSSVAYGFWTEHGPFRLAQNGTVVEPYEFSWNRKASVLYVEQPSGVGLSWSADTAHYVTNDEQASQDNLLFLKSFFQVFPGFRKNPFFVTGESYGGHYVPQLCNRILDDPEFTASINMHGLWIGNPGINSDWYYNINEYAFLTFMYTHALLPLAAYQPCVDACDWDEFTTKCTKDFTHPSPACQNATHAAWKYLPQTWDPYNLSISRPELLE